MAYEVIWSPEAIEDFEAIVEYLARTSTRYASTAADKLIEAGEGLSHFPFAGRVVPEFDDKLIREKFVHNYRLIYRVDDETVTVLVIIHGRRLLVVDKG
jgi:toxin ParE1/3/4